MFSTIAVIFRHGFIVLIIALRTFPIEDVIGLSIFLLVDVFDPLLDAFEVHRDAAATAGPNVVSSSDLL